MLLSIICAYLLADLLSGVFHWIEDRYLTEDMPVIGKYVAIPNDRHHREPTRFLDGGYWTRNWTTLLPAGALSITAYLFGAPVWLWLSFAFLTQGNEIHAWSHRRVASRTIRGLQEFGVFQSARHHAVHHKSPFDCRYCVMTDWLNPVLDAISFWTIAERLLAMFGVKTRVN